MLFGGLFRNLEHTSCVFGVACVWICFVGETFELREGLGVPYVRMFLRFEKQMETRVFLGVHKDTHAFLRVPVFLHVCVPIAAECIHQGVYSVQGTKGKTPSLVYILKMKVKSTLAVALATLFNVQNCELKTMPHTHTSCNMVAALEKCRQRGFVLNKKVG